MAAISLQPLRRSRLMAVLRKVARLWGAWPTFT